MRPFKILVCGMPRSMTTWIFNVIRELLSQEKIRCVWIEPGSKEERLFSDTSDFFFLAKCHHFNERLASAADLVFYSFRDLRSAAVSCHRKFGSAGTADRIREWIEAGKSWMPVADLCFRYETLQEDPGKGIASIREVLQNQNCLSHLSLDSDEDILARVEKKFQEEPRDGERCYDAESLVFPNHRTGQPDPSHLPPEEKEIYIWVEKEFSEWLRENGYLPQKKHGQEVEYRIAEDILRYFSHPLVIDVGMERGSFTECVLSAGAVKVIGFECLPRHIAFLQQRYRQDPRVEIHSLAVSDKTGPASLHIATDRNGSELDYHHTLSDLGDSTSVIRSGRILPVQSGSLAGGDEHDL